MTQTSRRQIYGPVPSRRLGRSLGIDLAPFKTCTYDCIYCQLGRTTAKTIERKEYVAVDEVLSELERSLASGSAPDYISLAGSGEPTLNVGLGELIGKIKSLTNVPTAVLTNGSLLWSREVQDSLLDADLVLPSLDAGDERLFRYVNRPHREITFDRMVDGLAEFTARFAGEVWLEVMLLDGVTGIAADAEKIAALARRIGPARIQLNTVTRPPVEDFAFATPPDQMNKLSALFSGTVEVISDDEDGRPSAILTGVATNDDVLALLDRRPCTIHGLSKGLDLRPAEALKRLDELRRRGLIVPIRKNRSVFYTTVKLR